MRDGAFGGIGKSLKTLDSTSTDAIDVRRSGIVFDREAMGDVGDTLAYALTVSLYVPVFVTFGSLTRCIGLDMYSM